MTALALSSELVEQKRITEAKNLDKNLKYR